MKIKRWDGSELLDVPVQQLPTYAREGLYVEAADGTRHFWAYSGPDPVPSGSAIKNRIEKEVPKHT